MNKLKKFLKEEPKQNKPRTTVDVTRERQAREKEQLRLRQSRELAKAREQDFRAKEAQKRAVEQQRLAKQRATTSESKDLDFGIENSNIYEYLEDGTFELIYSYKKVTPGQD